MRGNIFADKTWEGGMETRAGPSGSCKIRLIKEVAFRPGLDINPPASIPSVITPTFLFQFCPPIQGSRVAPLLGCLPFHLSETQPLHPVSGDTSLSLLQTARRAALPRLRLPLRPSPLPASKEPQGSARPASSPFPGVSAPCPAPKPAWRRGSCGCRRSLSFPLALLLLSPPPLSPLHLVQPPGPVL